MVKQGVVWIVASLDEWREAIDFMTGVDAIAGPMSEYMATVESGENPAKDLRAIKNTLSKIDL